MALYTKSGLGGLIRSLASLRLAVVILGLLAAVLAIATIYESKNDSAAAQRYFYQAWWFDLLLLLLAVNVAAAAIIRWPWRLKMIGFVVTHVALLTILGGCLTTRWLGVTGRLSLAEGKQDSKILQDGWVVQATSHGVGSHGENIRIPISQPPRPGTTTSFKVAGQACTMKVLQYLPNAAAETQLAEGTPDDPAGMLVELAQSSGAMGGRSSQQWLLVDDKGQWAVSAAGFSLAAASQYTAPAAPSTAPASAKGTLVATIDGKEQEVDVEQAMAAPVPLADGRATLHVTGYYEHASVGMGGKLTEAPDKPVNPAVMLELIDGGKKEKRIIFAKFGDIGAMHGGDKNQAIKMSLRHAQSAAGMKVVLVPQPDKWVLYEDNGSKVLQQVDLQPDTSVTLKGMPVSLVVRKILPHARPEKQVVAKPLPKGAEAQPAMEVELTGPGGQRRDWLAWSQPAMFVLGPKALRLTFGPQQAPLPFAVRLDKFELEHYAGSNMPAMYRSEVTVIDAQSREQRTVTIEMNSPLEYKGWSFFQSGYSMNEGQNITILSVSKDPGKPIVYCGAFLLVVGTAVLAIQRLKAQVPVAGRNGPARSAAQTGKKETVVTGTDHE